MKRVLVVDDEKYIRRGLKSMIEYTAPQQLSVQVARDGQEAIDLLGSGHFDMLFTDINMPRMNGVELIRGVRAMNLELVIIIISGYNEFNYAVEGLRNGVVDYLLKPINRDNVKTLLERYLAQEPPPRDPAYTRELLVRDIRCAFLDPAMAPEDIAQVRQRLLDTLGADCCRVVCLSRRPDLPAACGAGPGEGALYVPDIAGRHYLFVGGGGDQPPAGLPLYAGMAQLCAGDALLPVCRRAEDAMKRAFIAGGGPLVWDGEEDEAEAPPAAEVTGLVYYVDEGRVSELQQLLESRVGQAGPEYLERLFTAMLDMLAEHYPRFCAAYTAIDQKLRDPYQFPTLKAWLSEMYGYLYILSGDIQASPESGADRLMETAIAYIHENHHRDISLAMVAEHVGRNYSALSRAFKEYTGQSFVHYLKNVRIEKACGLLREGTMKTAEIAAGVGFYSERHFAKVFKELKGITPTEYRRLSRHR